MGTFTFALRAHPKAYTALWSICAGCRAEGSEYGWYGGGSAALPSPINPLLSRKEPADPRR
jgi:hypothetical protein